MVPASPGDSPARWTGVTLAAVEAGDGAGLLGHRVWTAAAGSRLRIDRIVGVRTGIEIEADPSAAVAALLEAAVHIGFQCSFEQPGSQACPRQHREVGCAAGEQHCSQDRRETAFAVESGIVAAAERPWQTASCG